DWPATTQARGRMGCNAMSVVAVRLILREKLAAILYCDTSKDAVPPAEADLIEILVVFAGKIIDMLSAVPKATIAARTTGNMAERAAAIRAGGEEVRERANVPRPPAPPPPPPSQVSEGRRQKDLYERLKEDIERGRQMYAERVPGTVRDATNYFYDELVRILAGGDAGALGPM